MSFGLLFFGAIAWVLGIVWLCCAIWDCGGDDATE
jgi:hypothetical protein